MRGIEDVLGEVGLLVTVGRSACGVLIEFVGGVLELSGFSAQAHEHSAQVVDGGVESGVHLTDFVRGDDFGGDGEVVVGESLEDSAGFDDWYGDDVSESESHDDIEEDDEGEEGENDDLDARNDGLDAGAEGGELCIVCGGARWDGSGDLRGCIAGEGVTKLVNAAEADGTEDDGEASRASRRR